jgi:hypothetical protein
MNACITGFDSFAKLVTSADYHLSWVLLDYQLNKDFLA